MSIHNYVDVPDSHSRPAKAFTRDRLGKRHFMADENGDSPAGNLRKKPLVLTLMLLWLGCGTLYALEAEPKSASKPLKGPNTQVTSDDTDAYSVSRWMNDKDKKPDGFSGIGTGSSSLGISENGDPNMSTRF